MKKIFGIILSIVMVMSLAACGNDSEETTAANVESTTIEANSEINTTTEELTTKETSSEELSSEEESASDEETSKEDSSEDATTEKNTTEKVTTEKNTTEKNTTEKKTTEKNTTEKKTTEKITTQKITTEKTTTKKEETTTKKEETTTKKEEETTEPETTVDYGTGTVTVWVPESIVDTVQSAANKFIASDKAYAGYSVKVEGVGITDTAMNALADIESTADIYLFSYDQYERLKVFNCLTEIKGQYKEYIEKNIADDAVAASKLNNSIYAYPATLNNGFFLYYDKSVISNPNSLEQMIKDCEAKGKNYYFNVSNGWYTPAFYLATGCYFKSEIIDEENNIDTTNVASQQGIIAVREIIELVDSDYFKDSQTSPFENPGFIVTGTWEEANIKNVLGDNFEASKLPEFVGCDGKTYQMSGFSGYTLFGIKPQSYVGKEEICKLLLNYLTRESVQLDIYKVDKTFGPVNKEARNDSSFKNNKTSKALLEQSKYSIPQGILPNGIWTGAYTIGKDIVNGTYNSETTDEELLNTLLTWQRKITGEKMPEEEWVEDGLREKLVEAAIAVRQKYMTENSLDEITMETGAFYDFNYDGVPEYCLMQADAYFRSRGLVYEYVNGEYVLKGSLTDYESLETYKDAEGNYYNTSYRYWMSTGNHITDEDFNEDMRIQEYKFWDFTNEYFIGTSFEPISSNDVDSPVYYNSSNQEVTKDEFDAIMNSYIQGMTKLNYCGGLRQQIGTAVEENINKAYISYLQKKNYR